MEQYIGLLAVCSGQVKVEYFNLTSNIREEILMYDFYADTKSIPTKDMLRSILDAELGDEQKGEDPTTKALEARVAKLLGMEAAIFLISGTMCNEIAVRVHCKPGDEIICDETAHLLNFECGGPAALSGVGLMPIAGKNGIYDRQTLKKAIRPLSRYMPLTKMILVEQTTNLGGGGIWPLETIRDVVAEAKEHGLIAHMDGARLLNAVVKTGIPADEYTKGFDTAWIDFSKGLGAPCGGVLAGSKEFIEKAWREKQTFGGAMRQSGVLAAPCIYALDHHLTQLKKDNDLAFKISEGLKHLTQVVNIMPVETNIIIFDVIDKAPIASKIVEDMKAKGFLMGAFGERRLRIVTCINVDDIAGDLLLKELSHYLSAYN
jgi:threonine aldolase